MTAFDDHTWLDHLLDDASVFPPSSLPLPAAVTRFREHRASAYSGIVGNLVVPDVRLPELLEVLDEHDGEDETLPVSVLVTGGAGALESAVRWASRAPLLDLRSVRIALRADGNELAANARRVLTAVDVLDEDLSGARFHVELPTLHGEPSTGWLSALDEVAAAGTCVTLRTGGPDGCPSAEDVAAAIEAVLDRELPFSCVGGLRSAVREDADSHGVLNLLVATRACLDGEDAVDALRATSAYALLDGRDPAALERTRRWLLTVGTPDVLEPHHDLVELGVLAS